MATDSFPSGSGWGSKELNRIGFELEPRRFPLEEFPWKVLLPDSASDPCAGLESLIETLFGSQEGEDDSANVLAAAPFYEALKVLHDRIIATDSDKIHRTRAKPSLCSSSPLNFPSSPTRPTFLPYENEETSLCKDQNDASSSQASVGNSANYDRVSQEQPYRSFHFLNQESQNSDLERTPPAKEAKRRRLGVEVQVYNSETLLRDESGQGQSLNQATGSISESSFGVIVNSNEDLVEHPSSQVSKEQAPSTPARLIGQSAIPFAELLLPSSQSDSTYKYTSPESQATIGSLPSARKSQRDQAEANTNTMIYLFLKIVSKHILKSKLDNGIELAVSHDTEALLVSVGGYFITTKPDLKVALQRNKNTVTLLDYEGKRLKPNMTAEEKFAQEVCHMIGRARHNMSNESTKSRMVFLLAAQHTSVSILSCKLKRKWLVKLQEDDLVPLTRIDKQFVEEYGPADLENPKERLLFVQMLCRLLVHLVNESKLGRLENDEKRFSDQKEGGNTELSGRRKEAATGN